MNTEQKQRIEQIEAWQKSRRGLVDSARKHADLDASHPEIRMHGYIDFLLSIVKEQEAKGEQSTSGDQANGDDRTERLLQLLVETPAGERVRMKCGAADLRSVISDIASSLPYVVNEVDAERLADYHKIGSMPAIIKSTDYGADTLAECVEKAVDRWYYRGRRDAATSMRSLCVEKVMQMEDNWRKVGDTGSANTARHIAKELESVSLQEQKSLPCGAPRPDDGSECAFGFCPRPRDGCSEYCVDHHTSICTLQDQEAKRS